VEFYGRGWSYLVGKGGDDMSGLMVHSTVKFPKSMLALVT
jgi:hypothetical protein